VLLPARSRFERFAAMRTVGDLASPCYVQCPYAERAAARPFVIAFRACAENKVRTARKPEGSPESENRLRTLGLFPLIKFTPIKSVPPIPAPTLSYGTQSCMGQCRELRTVSYVSACGCQSFRNGRQLMLIRGLLSNLKSEECNPGRPDATASHFPRIGVLSAQSTVAT
jgi:hypothetical protein